MQRVLRPLLVCCALLLSGCGYNAIESARAEVDAAWKDMLAQYEYRDGMVNSLVATLAHYVPDQPGLTQHVRVAHEQTRDISDSEPPTDAATMRMFQERHAALSTALLGLLAAAESHPLLFKGDALTTLQSQVDEAQNRITGAQARYIRAVGAYNNKIKRFPVSLTARLMGKDTLPTMSIRQEAHESLVRPPQFDVRPVQRVPGKDGNALMPTRAFAS